jgi:ligand-binding SRPBCC domain-containing protein
VAEILIHYLHREQILKAPLERVWPYFADPKNLNELTPAGMNFEIIAGGDVPMYAGQIIEYRVEFISGLRSLWVTEIAHAREGVYFADEQRLGPYRFWYHEHLFQPDGENVKMTDRVTYALPFGLLGETLHAIWIARRLNQIFEYRQRKVKELFGEP